LFLGESVALLNAIFWALTGAFVKRAGPGLKTGHVMIAHNWFAGVCVTLLAAATWSFDDIARLPGWVLGLLAGGAVINAGGQFLFFRALSTGHVGTVYTTTQGLFIVFSLSAGAIFLDEEVKVLMVPGAVAIIGGLYVMNVLGASATTGATASTRKAALASLGLAAATSLFWAFGLLTTARAIKETDLASASFLRNIVPALMYLPVAWLSPGLRLSTVPRSARPYLAISAVFFVAGFLTFLYSITKIPAGRSALISSTSPVFALLLSVLLLHERLTRVAVAGACLSLLGMALVLAAR
jgi:drug/metabolite transporter (DMT)-like permease